MEDRDIVGIPLQKNNPPKMPLSTLRIGSLRNWPQAEDAIIERLDKAHQDNWVKQINFWNIEFTPGITAAFRRLLMLNPTRSWNTVKILSCTGQITSIVSTIFISERVASLVLSGSGIDNQTFSVLNSGLKNNRSLKALRLISVRFSENTPMFDELSRNSSLAELDLTRSRLGTTNLFSVVKAMTRNQHLRVLKLDHCSLHDEALGSILHACTQCPSIQELYLAHNISGKDSFRALSILVRSLSTLDLHCQPIVESWSSFFHSLAHATNLRHLDLSGNRFSQQDIGSLATALESNNAIEYVNLQDCQLSDQAIQRLAASLPRWKSLQKLNLAANLFPEKSAEFLVQGVKQNVVLQDFGHLFFYQCSDELQFYLDCNYWGKGKIMQHPHVPRGLWPIFLARINHLPQRDGEKDDGGRRESVLFSMLHGPVLLER